MAPFLLRLRLRLLFILFMIDIMGVTQHVEAELNLLMVGNSFVDANSLEEMIQKMLHETSVDPSIYAMRFKQYSSRFAEHANNSALQDMIAERRWTWVVLQEQSEIPAFWDTWYEPTMTISIQAAIKLNQWIAADQADTVLMMTWARVTFDPYYPDLFPNFTYMQSKLVQGYVWIQGNISTPERPVAIAPVGLAFEKVRNATLLEYSDPAEAGSDFANLYVEDGIHPSVQGSYLAACVIFATLRPDQDVRRVNWIPGGISADARIRLQEVAWATVQEFRQQNEITRLAAERSQKNSAAKDSDVFNKDKEKRPYVPPYTPSDEDAASPKRSLSPKWVGIVALISLVALAFWLQKRGPQKKSSSSSLRRRGDDYSEVIGNPDLELVDLQRLERNI